MCIDDDASDCLCQMLMCFGCCYLCKKCCGCDDRPQQAATHQTIVVHQPGPNQFQQPMYDPNQQQVYYPNQQGQQHMYEGQWQQQPGYYPPQQQGGYPGFPQQGGAPAYYPPPQQPQIGNAQPGWNGMPQPYAGAPQPYAPHYPHQG